MKRLGICLCFCLGLAVPVHAQEVPPDDPASDQQYKETQDIIDAMHAKLATINRASTARDKEIEFLNKKINEAIGMIATGREDSASLRDENTELESELQNFFASTDTLNSQLTVATTEKEKLLAELENHVSSLADLLSLDRSATNGLSEQMGAISSELKTTIDTKNRTEQDLDEARQTLDQRQKEIATLTSRATTGEERAARAQADMRALNEQLTAIRKQLEGALGALQTSEERGARQQVRIADLGKKLNLALAERVQELSQYRSEFFGRLRKALGERRDIRVVGDRFVFQSEVLFASGSADLDPGGVETLRQLAATLGEVAREIPPDLQWVLRVDGHTDRIPIYTARFASNWELSSARAISVVKYLVEQGIMPGRLAATGFGEYQPLDPRNDEVAHRRNRRIEFKLTQR
jgi:chemotaxis protein MotB